MALVVFFTALVTLAVEVFYTRLFAALFWKDTAFAILSLAMLGIGASGVAVYVLPGWFPKERAPRQIAWWTLAFGASITLSYIGVLLLSRTTDNMLAPVWGYGPLIFVGLLPFFCGGMVLSLVFTHHAGIISRLYLFDLTGAAVGSVLVLPMLSGLNGPAIVPALSLLAVTAAVAYAREQRLPAVRNTGIVLALGLCGLWVAQATGNVLGLTHSQGRRETTVELERWDPLARITVHRSGPGWMWFSIDSRVITPLLRYEGDPSQVAYLKQNVLQLAYHLRNYDDIVIIGPGGGSDVLSALVFGNDDITAVEVNRTMVDLVRGKLADYTGDLYNRPEVEVVIEDGRAYVAGMDEKVDLIQATFIDTVTASSSGAHTLSENYLYTVDAINDFFDHLKDGGVLSMSRWGGRAWGYAETHRALALMAAALRERGVRQPGDHLVAVRGPSPDKLTRGFGYQNIHGHMESMTTILAKPRPFSVEELDEVERVSEQASFVPLWMGSRGGDSTTIRRIIAGDDGYFDRYYQLTGLDIRPVTDDRPFFFDMVRPLKWLVTDPKPRWTANPSYFAASVGVRVLGQLLASSSVLVLLLIVVPLLFRLKDLRGLRRPVSTLGYFVCLGLGYIGVEISTMQRLALFLEHPIYSMVVVLGSMLLFSGLGSLITARVQERWALSGAKRALLLVAILAVYGALLPILTDRMMGFPFAVKVLLAVALLFPPSFLMGMLFSLGIGAIGQRAPRLVPWVWGLNSSFSVLGAIASLFIAMSFGHTATWYAFSGVYALGAIADWRMAGLEG